MDATDEAVQVGQSTARVTERTDALPEPAPPALRRTPTRRAAARASAGASWCAPSGGASSASSCWRSRSGVVWALRPRPVPVDVATAARGGLVVAVEETGVARVKDRYVVSAPVAGVVSRQLLEPGDAVAEGQVVAELAPLPSPLLDARTRSEAEARLSAATSALGQAQAQKARTSTAEALARDELSRARSLAAGGSLPAQQLDRAEFEARMRSEELASAVFAVKVSAEQVRLARAALAGEGAPRGRRIEVLAPASGRVLRVLQESEGVVLAGAPLLEVGNPEVLELVVDLLTTDAVRVHPGTTLAVHGLGRRRHARGPGAPGRAVRVHEAVRARRRRAARERHRDVQRSATRLGRPRRRLPHRGALRALGGRRTS